MKLNLYTLNDEVSLPKKGTDGSACYDLQCFDGTYNCHKNLLTFVTKVVFEIPKGYHIKIYARSGVFEKYGIMLVNNVGIIDSDYRGEVKVLFTYFGDDTRWRRIRDGERLVQFELVKNGFECEFNAVQELSETDRGSDGFGSTGK